MEWGSRGWDPSLTVVSNGGWRMSRACAKLLVLRWLVVSPMVLMPNHLRWFRLLTRKRKHLLPERCSKSGPSVREWVSVCYLQSSPSVEASVLGYLFEIWAWGEGGRLGIHSWVLVKRPEISWERFWRRDFLNVNPSLLPSSTVLTESEGTRCLWETRKCLVANNSFLPGIDSLKISAGFYKPKARLSSMRHPRGTSRSDGLGISPIPPLAHLWLLNYKHWCSWSLHLSPRGAWLHIGESRHQAVNKGHITRSPTPKPIAVNKIIWW